MFRSDPKGTVTPAKMRSLSESPCRTGTEEVEHNSERETPRRGFVLFRAQEEVRVI